MRFKLLFIKGIQSIAVEELNISVPDAKIDEIQKDAIILRSFMPFDFLRASLHSFTRIENLETGYTAVMASENWRRAFVPAGIHPSLAYAMCRLARIDAESILLDPMCGGGTIPIIAHKYFNPKMVIASDKSGSAVDKTLINSKNAQINKQFMCFRSDIRHLKLGENSISRIITNMPFGIRVDSHKQNIQTYVDFYQKCVKIIQLNGLIVVLTQEKKLFSDLFDSQPSPFQKVAALQIESGGLKPFIYIYKKH